jgi:cation diffusion facilitator family transporter
MAVPSSTRVIYAALIGNLAIAVAKFGAASVTGSSAMVSEAIHSVVDTGNQWLLLYGIRRARRPPDASHPFGYGMEIYFWTFVVAMLVFALGAGLSIYEGIKHIRAPRPLEDPTVSYVVLAVAAVFEAAAWGIAYKEFNHRGGWAGLLAAVIRSKDPTVFTVLFEDSAALLGLAAAALGIFASQALRLPVVDGVASVVIGLILAGTAILLAYESKGLLIGESAHPETVRAIRALLAGDERILRTNEVLTMHLGPTDVLLNLSLDFRDDLSSTDVERFISEMERRIKAAHPEVTRVFIEAQSWRAHLEEQGRSAAANGKASPPREAAAAEDEAEAEDAFDPTREPRGPRREA